ncbi:MAG: acylphosphatase [Pseudooceanicola sp.]|nr:acylphosphatase [Pseudooceanicola sp.]
MADVVVLARVTGMVQGVWFRAWTRREAERLGLRGWVRNEADGSVLALVGGRGELVEEMVRLLHIGPAKAKVEQVVTDPWEGPVPGDFGIEG